MQKEIFPKLSVVGAGPGAADLLTIRAVNVINSADVILYDALVGKEILKYARIDALKIYVGKRKNQHSYSQDEINQLIIDLAFTHGHVVRLKGGDPFVFGRGKEEINYAESFNIPAEYIPGISSSISVPGLAGIPVTHRGSSESFWVITGTTRNGTLSKDIIAAAKTDATAIILMGIDKLKQITQVYKAHQKNDLPVAVIQNGSLPEENMAIGTIDTIEKIVKDEKIDSPAVIVIGEVVKQSYNFLNLDYSNVQKWALN